MKRFLLIALAAGLLSPISVNAEKDEIKHICALWSAQDIDGRQAAKRLGLKNKDLSDADTFMKVFKYCRMYINGMDRPTNQ